MGIALCREMVEGTTVQLLDGVIEKRSMATPQGEWLVHCWPTYIFTMDSTTGCRIKTRNQRVESQEKSSLYLRDEK